MTNGEKIKELFPHFDVEDKTEYFGRIRNLDDHFIKADIDFWNAEYEEPTTPNDCETCIHNKGVLECDMYGCKYEPTTKNDSGVDAISRADALSDKGLGEFHFYEDYAKMRNYLKSLPSVTPQERKGHWIADVDRWGDVVTTVNGYRCDKCNTFNADKDNYCPNCGAKMESEVNNG